MIAIHNARFRRWIVVSLVILGGFVVISSSVSVAQTEADRIADEALREAPAEAAASGAESGSTTAAKINLLQLIWDASWLMLPIILMSIVVVAVGIERGIALQRSRVIPTEVVTMVQESTKPGASFSPKRMYAHCSENPSPLSNVVKSILVKLGRPSAEVEKIASETIQRESDRLYQNVRMLNLAAAVTPLVGLLGTVWGMIEAFFATANMPAGQKIGESLAAGIYTALITTAGGLVVAIPAAVLAHMYEGKIERLFLDVHELVYTRLMPQAERLEGRTAADVADSGQTSKIAITSPPPVPKTNGSQPQTGAPPIQASPS